MVPHLGVVSMRRRRGRNSNPLQKYFFDSIAPTRTCYPSNGLFATFSPEDCLEFNTNGSMVCSRRWSAVVCSLLVGIRKPDESCGSACSTLA